MIYCNNGNLSAHHFLWTNSHNQDYTISTMLNTSSDDDLLLFQEMHKQELLLLPPSPTALSSYDVFNLDSGKHDYDWLLTPPTTPLIPTLDCSTPSLSALKTSKSEPPSRAEPTRSARGNLGFQQPTNDLSSTSLRRSAPSSSSNTVSRPSRQSPTSSNRPSTPSASAGAPRLSLSSSNSSVCPSTLSNRSSNRPVTTSSSRPSTPVRRSVNACYHPHSLTRSVSVSNATSLMSKSVVSSRATSPTARDRAWPAVFPGFSQEPPPNLRTSMLERSNSTSRVSSMGSRPGKLSTAKATKADVLRQQSTSTLTPRCNLSVSQNGGTTIRRNDAPVSNAIGSKSADRKMRFRKPVLSAQQEPCSIVDVHVKHSGKSAASQDVDSTIASARDSSGFGRNLSKKSLDMALKHMDIHRSNPSGFRSSISHIFASSIFSARSSNRRAVSTNSAVDSPMATSSNTSSEHSMGIVLDPESSEAGDEAVSEKGSKSISPASLPESVVCHSKKTRISSWLDSPDYGDDNAEVIQLFEQDIERLSGFESPLVSQHEGFSDCDDFTLEPL